MDIIQIVELLKSKNIQIELYWVPTHSSLNGNKRTVKVAKESTGLGLIKHQNNHIVEKDTNKTTPKVFISPIKMVIKAYIESILAENGQKHGRQN